MPTISLRRLVPAILFLTSVCLLGCGKGAPRPETEKAEAAIGEFLDAWTRGDTPDKFASSDKPIQANDPDWKAGYRLLSFLNVEAKPSPDTPNGFRCRVALSMQDRKGKKMDKDVVYDVRMGGTIRIDRAAR